MQHELIQEGEFTYVSDGEGPVLLILHGLFGALSNFTDVFAEFRNSYTVVAPVMPIYDLPIPDTHVRSLSAFIHRFVELRGYDHVNILGNSLGGHVALVYCLDHPEKIISLTLTGSSGLYENAMGGTYPRKEDKEYLRQKIGFTFYDPTVATDELVDEVFEIVNSRDKLIRILALAKSAIRHNMAEELHKYKMPVCLIWGKNDNVTPPDVAEEFHRLIEGSDLFWIDECGHAPMMERPQEFNRILKPWLDGVNKVVLNA